MGHVHARFKSAGIRRISRWLRLRRGTYYVRKNRPAPSGGRGACVIGDFERPHSCLKHKTPDEFEKQYQNLYFRLVAD
jgi:transposase InsO family protein